MVLMELQAEWERHHGTGDHHDDMGMGGMEEMFDPERANQAMLEALPQFM